MSTDVKSIIEDPASFVKRANAMPVGDLCAQIAQWTIKDLQAMNDANVLGEIMETMPQDAFKLIEAKIQPTATRALPGTKSHWAVVSVTNMRTRANFQLLTTAMIAYMYRALKERSKEDACEHFDLYFSREQHDLIKAFLDVMLVYDPTESIDRYTSELYTPKEAVLKQPKPAKKGKNPADEIRKRQVRAETATIESREEPTKVKDRSKRYSPDVSKMSVQERSSATIKFDDGIDVEIDPPSDFYGRFFTFYNTHFDAIYRTTFELFLEGRASEDIVHEKNRFDNIREEVQVYHEVRDPATGKMVKGDKIGDFVFPAPTAQWQDTILIIAPDNGKFSTTLEDASAELKRHKDLSISDLSVVPTNATVMMASWYAGKRNVITDDRTTNALLERLERDQKIFGEMNKKRVENAKFREMIAEGTDATDFTDYMRQSQPNYNLQALDEQDELEIKAKYATFKATHKMFSNDDKDFLDYVKQRIGGRNLDSKPLTLEERKKWSREFVDSRDVPELRNDSEMAALDFYEMGGYVENPGLEKRRDYTTGVPTQMKK